jgi:hypothetical protein
MVIRRELKIVYISMTIKQNGIGKLQAHKGAIWKTQALLYRKVAHCGITGTGYPAMLPGFMYSRIKSY